MGTRDAAKKRAAECSGQSASNKRIKLASSSEAGHPDLKDSDVGYGLLGLGDCRYPVNCNLFTACSRSQGFVANLAAQFAKTHSEAVATDAVEPPEVRPHSHCEEFCMTAGLTGVNPDLFNMAKRLLTDITRLLKGMYKQIKKEITPAARHPVLLARWVSPEGQEHVCGWLITSACFKPFRLDCIELRLPDQLVMPCEVELKTLRVRQSEAKLFVFGSTNHVATTIARLNPTQNVRAGSFSYMYNVGYKLRWQRGLTRLWLLGRKEWVSMGLCAPGDKADLSDHDSDEGDGDTGDEDDTAEIEDLVGMLVGSALGNKSGSKGRSGQTKSKKPAKRAAKQEPSGHGFIALCCRDSFVQVFLIDNPLFFFEK